MILFVQGKEENSAAMNREKRYKTRSQILEANLQFPLTLYFKFSQFQNKFSFPKKDPDRQRLSSKKSPFSFKAPATSAVGKRKQYTITYKPA